MFIHEQFGFIFAYPIFVNMQFPFYVTLSSIKPAFPIKFLLNGCLQTFPYPTMEESKIEMKKKLKILTLPYYR